MDYACGEVYSGCFTVRLRAPRPHSHRLTCEQNSDSLWAELDAAGRREHDRFWRMPLDEEYGPQIYSSNADLCNVRPITCFAFATRVADARTDRRAGSAQGAARRRCSSSRSSRASNRRSRAMSRR